MGAWRLLPAPCMALRWCFSPTFPSVSSMLPPSQLSGPPIFTESPAHHPHGLWTGTAGKGCWSERGGVEGQAPESVGSQGVAAVLTLGIERGQLGSQQEQAGLCRCVLVGTGECALGSVCGVSTHTSVPEAVGVPFACEPFSLRPGRLCEETSVA